MKYFRLLSFLLLVGCLTGCVGKGLFTCGKIRVEDQNAGKFVHAISSAILLFDGAADEGLLPDSDFAFVDPKDALTRFRKVDINPLLTRSSKLAVGDTLLLNLFIGAEYLSVIEDISVNVQGTRTIRAEATDSEHVFILSSTGDRSLGLLHIPEKDVLYRVISDPDSKQHFLLEFRASAMEQPKEGGPIYGE